MTYTISTTWAVTLVVLLAWELFWKGLALWRAARLGHLYWFVFLLVIGSAGLLPMLYLLDRRGHKQSRGELHGRA
jgi:hypothetical protein